MPYSKEIEELFYFSLKKYQEEGGLSDFKDNKEHSFIFAWTLKLGWPKSKQFEEL